MCYVLPPYGRRQHMCTYPLHRSRVGVLGSAGRRTPWMAAMTFRPAHLSVSSVALYTRCPAQYRQRYVDKLVTPTTAPQATGTAFHRALEAEHRGQDSERAWIAAANSTSAALAASGLDLTMSKAHGLDLLNLYRERGLGGKKGEPERKFVLPFPSPHIPVPLLGYIDLAVPDEREYRDFKTTAGTSWNAVKVALEPQLHAYGWAYQQLYRHRAERALWVVFSTRTVAMDVYEALPSPDGFRAFELEAEAAWQGIVAGRYDPCGVCKELCAPPIEKPSNGPTFVWEDAS